jgi:ribosome-binding protein aMBF1 (putative translation factor)
MYTKDKLITIQEFKNKVFKTKEDKEIYQKGFKRFEVENDIQVLLELGQQLKTAREKAGITQEELAKKIKTNKGNISRMEHGKQNLTVEYIVRVAQVLQRPVRIEIL